MLFRKRRVVVMAGGRNELTDKRNKEQSCYAIVLTLAEMFNWGNLLKEHVSNQSGMFDERANEYATRFNDEILGLMDSICSFFRLSITWGI